MKKTLSVLLLAALLASQAYAATYAQDVDRYLATLTTDQTGAALEPLGWAGISDPRLFDAIEAELQTPAAQRPENKSDIKKYRHYVRALGFSGQSKYTPTLNALVRNKNYENYAEHALRDQPNYAKWNPIISNRATFSPQRSDDVNRYMNMLAADDLVLNRIACRRIVEGVRDDALFELLEKKVRASYMRTGLSGNEQDGLAWLVKALGSSKDAKYRDLLQEVANSGAEKGVVRHAQKALEEWK